MKVAVLALVVFSTGVAITGRHRIVRADVVTFAPACDFTWQTCCNCATNAHCVNWDVPATGGSACPELPSPLDDVVIEMFCQVDPAPAADAIARTIVQGGDTFRMDGNLLVASSATFEGLFWWNAGSLARTSNAVATVNIHGDMLLTDASVRLLGANGDHPGGVTLVNRATIDWVGGGGIALGNSETGNSPSRIVNEASALIDLQSDALVLGNEFGHGVITNAGIIQKSAGDGASEWTVQLVNSGVVHVQSGELHLLGDGSNAGEFHVDEGTRLVLAPSAPFVLMAGSIVTGEGEVVIRGAGGGAVHLLGAMNFNRLVVEDGGEIGPQTSSPGELNITEALRLDGASIFPPVRVLEDAAMSLMGPDANSIGELMLEGTLEVFDDADLIITGTAGTAIDHFGTIRKVSDDGMSEFVSQAGGSIRVNAGGIVEVLSGTLSMDAVLMSRGDIHVAPGAALKSPHPIELNGGSLTGSGTVIANVENLAATIVPGSATSRTLMIASSEEDDIAGDYRQGSEATLTIEIGGPDKTMLYDRLVVDGAASLDGALALVLTDGFVPTDGELIGVLWAESINGKFSSVSATGLPSGVEAVVEYAAKTVIVTFKTSENPSDSGAEGDDDGTNGDDMSDVVGGCGACGDGAPVMMPAAAIMLASRGCVGTESGAGDHDSPAGATQGP